MGCVKFGNENSWKFHLPWGCIWLEVTSACVGMGRHGATSACLGIGMHCATSACWRWVGIGPHLPVWRWVGIGPHLPVGSRVAKRSSLGMWIGGLLVNGGVY